MIDNFVDGWGIGSYDQAAVDPATKDYLIGFRVAAVAEPEEYAAAFGIALLVTGVWLWRKKVQGVAACVKTV